MIFVSKKFYNSVIDINLKKVAHNYCMTLRDKEFMSMVDRNNCLLVRHGINIEGLTYILENQNEMIEQLHKRLKKFEDIKNDGRKAYYTHQESEDSV